MDEVSVKISGGGRVVIPAEFRKVLDLKEGDEIILRLGDNGELLLLTKPQAIRKAQLIVQQYVAGNRSMADELIAERKLDYDNE
jgi:AbrB family looped-hinge helix DNA binding protein